MLWESQFRPPFDSPWCEIRFTNEAYLWNKKEHWSQHRQIFLLSKRWIILCHLPDMGWVVGARVSPWAPWWATDMHHWPSANQNDEGLTNERRECRGYSEIPDNERWVIKHQDHHRSSCAQPPGLLTSLLGTLWPMRGWEWGELNQWEASIAHPWYLPHWVNS